MKGLLIRRKPHPPCVLHPKGDWLLAEAQEQMTRGGLHIEILPTRARNAGPWGPYRFRKILPLNLVSWDDAVR